MLWRITLMSYRNYKCPLKPNFNTQCTPTNWISRSWSYWEQRLSFLSDAFTSIYVCDLLATYYATIYRHAKKINQRLICHLCDGQILIFLIFTPYIYLLSAFDFQCTNGAWYEELTLTFRTSLPCHHAMPYTESWIKGAKQYWSKQDVSTDQKLLNFCYKRMLGPLVNLFHTTMLCHTLILA